MDSHPILRSLHPDEEIDVQPPAGDNVVIVTNRRLAIGSNDSGWGSACHEVSVAQRPPAQLSRPRLRSADSRSARPPEDQLGAADRGHGRACPMLKPCTTSLSR
jgi:hypothetical protein